MTYQIFATRLGTNQERRFPKAASNEIDARKLLDEHWLIQKKSGNNPTEIKNNSFSSEGVRVRSGINEVYTDFYSIRIIET